jgi:hypothetical protein
MSIQLNNESITRRYSDQALDRAAHHGRNVKAVVPSIIGYVKAYADPGSIRIREGYASEMGNMAWATFGGRRIAFCYNHGTMMIEAREGSLRGRALAIFDNATTQPRLLRFFEGLGR